MEKIGYIAVDAGVIFVGDPCYTMPDDGSFRDEVRDWETFADNLSKNGLDKNQYVKIGNQTGIVVSSGYGDGVYPVFVEKTKDGIVRSVKIVFDDEEELGDE